MIPGNFSYTADIFKTTMMDLITLLMAILIDLNFPNVSFIFNFVDLIPNQLDLD